MPCIAFQFNPQVGPLLQLTIVDPAVIKRGARPPANTPFYTALLDTGASGTCVSTKVVKAHSLPPTGKIPVIGVHGTAAVNTYHFGLGVLFPKAQSPAGALIGDMQIMLVDGTEFDNTGCGFDILAGRDFLLRGSLTLSFDGHGMWCL